MTDEIAIMMDRLIFAVEATNACLKTWNVDGSPVAVDDIVADARAMMAAREAKS